MNIDRGLLYCKLGGSVITDKTRPHTARPQTLSRLAGEIANALDAQPALRLVLGHGSGSFGHVEAHRHGTREGVTTASDWRGFAQVAAAAARLNHIVTDELLRAGVPAWSLPPSASARCRAGQLESLEVAPVASALDRGLVPLVNGDVALDDLLGGTIVSTEEVLVYLARHLPPERLILVSAVDGVFMGDPMRHPSAAHVPRITASNWPEVHAALGGSHAVDVTGGMLSKVEQMVALVSRSTGLTVHIVSGKRPGALEAALGDAFETAGGTIIRW